MTGPWWNPSDVYGSIGYTGINQGSPSGAHIGAITGRVDARYGKYFGVEGELSGGVEQRPHPYGPGPAACTSQYAAYAVGYLPVLPNADLFARIGYGESNEKFKGLGGYSDTSPRPSTTAPAASISSTAMTGCAPNTPARTPQDTIAPNADTVAVSYVRRF